MSKEKINSEEEVNAFQQVNESITDPNDVTPVPDEKVEEATDIINMDEKETPDRG